MTRVIKTPLAEQDLSEIFDFIAEYDPEQAVNYLSLIGEKCALLARFPQMGKTKHNLFVNLRSFPVKNHVIFYQPIENGVEIVRVLHGSRNIEGVFNEIIDEADRIN